MSLRDRLRSMRGDGHTTADLARGSSATSTSADVVGLPVAADAVDVRDAEVLLATTDPSRPARPAHGPESLLPGASHSTPHGACFVAEWRYPLDHQHGSAALGATLDATPGHGVALLARSAVERAAVAAADPARVVYLDTETTGLAGGTGTYAFLVGVARFAGDAFVVRQIFMRTLAEEQALLHLLAQELAECEVLVTYNGKAFDWPLLETRYALARRAGARPPRTPAAHVDLLFAARRLWRARLASCTLAQVEHDMLGVRRGEDTPGWLIPQLYFAYLRSQDARPLAGVFRHNALDLLSLVRLLGRVAEVAGAPLPQGVAPVQAGSGDPRAPALQVESRGRRAADELLALGRCFEEASDLDRALLCYEAALEGSDLSQHELRAAVVRDARHRTAAVLKRQRRGVEAAAHWEALLAAEGQAIGAPDIRAYEELAKYYEHAVRDHDRAQSYVTRALALLDGAAGHQATRERVRLHHRLARLTRLASQQT